MQCTVSNSFDRLSGYICKSLLLSAVLKEPSVKCQLINGDLHHAVAHQAGFIFKNSKGDTIISSQLHQLALNMMTKHPAVHLEDGLIPIQWLQKRMTILQPSE